MLEIKIKIMNQDIKNNTKKWFEDWVLKLNLCPFAHSVHAKKQIRFEIEESNDFKKCVQKAVAEINFLEENNNIKSNEYVDTTLVILPNQNNFNQSFEDFLDFIGLLDLFLEQNNLENKFELVAFHPNYIFAGEDKDSKSHYTNRCPYPILHILRKESIDKAVDSFGNIEMIPKKNIEKLEKMKEKDFEWLKSFSS